MAGTNLSSSKVVATPTINAWSQAYSAGSLFAAISLQNSSGTASDTSLNTLGKDLISTLESEFFSLETKDLESIKTAVNATVSRVNDKIELTFVICFLNENILYLYAAGGGKALLKRGEKIGTVIDSEEGRDIKSASGYVQDKDYIILQTKSFNQMIPSSIIASALDKEKVEDITEEIAPHVHEKEEGGASAVVLTYKENSAGIEPIEGAGVAAAAGGLSAAAAAGGDEKENVAQEETQDTEEAEKKKEEAVEEDNTLDEEIEKMEQELNKPSEETPETPKETPESEPTQKPEEKTPDQEETTAPFPEAPASRRRGPKIGLGRLKNISRRRLIAIIAVILIALLIVAGIYMFMGRGGSSGSEFDSIYNDAKEKYDEGLSLKELNESLAEENFKEAQLILVQNKDTFPSGSSEDDQIEELLILVNKELGSESGSVDTTTATEVDSSESQFLSVVLDNETSDYFTQNDDFIFFITNNGIIRVDKGNSEEEEIIDNDWTDAAGIGVFGSNVYVLDRDDNILKFVPSGDEYSKTDYITGDVPSFSDSIAMTIDGSIYVLDNDGAITKFTRGAEDDFTASGLSTPLSNPTKIWANEDQENIYILDNGNSRIVVLNGDGEFVKAYTANIIKNAKDFDVQEASSQIFVLSDGKIYKIELQ